MSDSLQEWTTYYQQLVEASRFAAAVRAQPSLNDSWNEVVSGAFAGGTVTRALDTLDSWISVAGYDTLSHMALDAVMPATPQPGDVYGPWRERLSEIAVTNGTLTFLQSMSDDEASAEAFEDQYTQYAITRVNAADSSSGSAASPDTELTYVTMLDARGTENIDAWIASQAVDISPPPNVAQVTRALLEQAGADLAQWVGDYGVAATQLVGYGVAAGVPGQSPTGAGPAIRIGGNASGLQLLLDGVLLQNVQWGEGPQATWQSGGGNAVGGVANLELVGNVDRGTVSRQVSGKFLVPQSVGNQYGGLSLTWPSGASFATISFQAQQSAGDSSGGISALPIALGLAAGVIVVALCCCGHIVAANSSAIRQALQRILNRPARVAAADTDDSRGGIMLNDLDSGKKDNDLQNMAVETKATTDKTTNIGKDSATSDSGRNKPEDESGKDGEHPTRGTTYTKPEGD